MASPRLDAAVSRFILKLRGSASPEIPIIMLPPHTNLEIQHRQVQDAFHTIQGKTYKTVGLTEVLLKVGFRVLSLEEQQLVEKIRTHFMERQRVVFQVQGHPISVGVTGKQNITWFMTDYEIQMPLGPHVSVEIKACATHGLD